MIATTVEQTSKSIKAVRTAGCLAVPVGMIFVLIGSANNLTFFGVIGVLCALGGMLAYLGAGLAKWWHHE
jgi:hypothetical protein